MCYTDLNWTINQGDCQSSKTKAIIINGPPTHLVEYVLSVSAS